MWDEIQELLIGLVGAVAVLAAIYAFYVAAHRQAEQEQPSNGPRDEPDADAKSSEPDLRERHEPLALEPADGLGPSKPGFPDRVAPRVEKIFTSVDAAVPMQRVTEVEAVAGRGLEGDRYFLGCGHWSESDQHEVTMIMQEDLDVISEGTELPVQAGQHRRNLVTRGIDLQDLMGKRFRIGTAYFSAARPRPPCLYLQRITEPGMAKALVGRGGIGVHCFHGGTVRENDAIVVLDLSLRRVIARHWAAFFGIAPRSRP